MLEIRCICVLYLLVTSGTGIITKYVCQGDSVKVFETVTFNSQDTVVSLYMNHQKHTLIAKWHMQNLTIKPHIQPEYKERVYLDEYGNIWIRNVNHWDEESYFIDSGINSSYVQHEVKINIMVAPNKNCKPKITHLDKFLIAHLEAGDCGNPVASLLWLDNHGFSNTSGSVINIPPGKEAGIYYACVTGPALECAKISVPSDYCSSYTIGENDSSTQALDILDLKTAIVHGIIVIGSLVLLIVALLLIPKIWRRIFIQKEDQHSIIQKEDQHSIIQKEDQHSREEITPFMKSRQPQRKHFGEEITPFMKSHQPQRKHFETFQGREALPLWERCQPQMEYFVPDVNVPNFSLLLSFPGKTENNKNKAWLLDVVLNPDHDLIVTDGQNYELKKFSLKGELKSKLSFESRPHCLAVTEGYHVIITFPFETLLRVVDTWDEMYVVSTIPFRLHCAGIGVMKDGRLIISNRESRSVYVCTKNGEILQEIKNDSSEETLFSKPSYVRVVDNTIFYVSDERTHEVFMIRLEAGNTFTVKKQKKVTNPRTSCVVYDLLLVAASKINIFTLDGMEAGEVTLDGVQHVRGLAFSEDKQLLAVTHKSDQSEKISVYQVRKH